MEAIFPVEGINPMASHLLGKHSTGELMLKAFIHQFKHALVASIHSYLLVQLKNTHYEEILSHMEN